MGRGGVNYIATGSKKKRLHVADSEGVRCGGIPHPGCFGKRGRIYLIPKELAFFATTKRLQEIEGARVRGGTAGGVSEVGSR